MYCHFWRKEELNVVLCFVNTASPEIKDISSPLTIISGISYYTSGQWHIKRIQYGGDHGSICKEACFIP